MRHFVSFPVLVFVQNIALRYENIALRNGNKTFHAPIYGTHALQTGSKIGKFECSQTGKMVFHPSRNGHHYKAKCACKLHSLLQHVTTIRHLYGS